MSVPRKLCSACLEALQSNLEEVLTRSLCKRHAHHRTFTDFQQAVAQDCFVCVQLWSSIRSDVLANWGTGSARWSPLRCSLSRRTWAPKWYDAIYWSFIYLEIHFQELDMGDLNYRGNVFCLRWSNDTNNEPEKARQDYEVSTASDAVHRQAYEWYQVCRTTHDTCKKLTPSECYIPTRLIDVGIDGIDTWKIVLRSEDTIETPDYFTLSYRWAQEPGVLLLKSNIGAYCLGTPIADLPRTFRDAIALARNFSIRYLWIDSLCIIQDSSEDWAHESVLMHDVYANSSCNIAASASEGPKGGLFRDRKPEDIELGYIYVDLPDLGSTRFDIWDQFYINRLTHGPLTDRGWVFQERILSPRILHFSQHQIAWECFEMSKCETWPRWSPYPTEIEDSHGLKTLYAFFNSDADTGYEPIEEDGDNTKMSVNVYKQWMHLLKAYSRCEFTYQEDRLVAMEGIAKMFEKHTGDECLAGLWRSRLVEGLNWIVVNPLARPPGFLTPSWSWASVNSAILPQPLNWPRDDDLIEIVDAKVKISGSSNKWNQVEGYIQMQGCLTNATIEEGSDSCALNAAATPIKIDGFPSKIFVLSDTIEVIFPTGTEIHLLPLRSTLRRQVEDTGTEAERLIGSIVTIIEGVLLEHGPGENIYRRIGRFVVDDFDNLEYFGLSYSGTTGRRVVMNRNLATTLTIV